MLHALKKGYGDIAILLIDKGADMNERTDSGWTPLHIMTWDGNEPMVRLLLEAGADGSAALSDGVTPLDIAKKRKFTSIESLLLQY